jgi:hypothetical protein
MEVTASGYGGNCLSSRGQATRSGLAAWGKQFFTVQINMLINVTQDLGFFGTNYDVANAHEVWDFECEEPGLLKLRYL